MRARVLVALLVLEQTASRVTDTSDANTGVDVNGGAGDADAGVDTSAAAADTNVDADTPSGKMDVASVNVSKTTGDSNFTWLTKTAAVVTPLPSTGGGAFASASVTDSNGDTHSVSKTSDGKPISVNVGGNARTASTGTKTRGVSTSGGPLEPLNPRRHSFDECQCVRDCQYHRFQWSHALHLEDQRRSNHGDQRGSHRVVKRHPGVTKALDS